LHKTTSNTATFRSEPDLLQATNYIWKYTKFVVPYQLVDQRH